MTGPAEGTGAAGPGKVVVIGTGLIGTSVALALREKGTEVFLSDADPATAKLAADLDAQASRCSRLESANREVARRLDLAIDTIRTVLDAHER